MVVQPERELRISPWSHLLSPILPCWLQQALGNQLSAPPPPPQGLRLVLILRTLSDGTCCLKILRPVGSDNLFPSEELWREGRPWDTSSRQTCSSTLLRNWSKTVTPVTSSGPFSPGSQSVAPSVHPEACSPAFSHSVSSLQREHCSGWQCPSGARSSRTV